jgi:PPOX class probable F420-dependent enzyme
MDALINGNRCGPARRPLLIRTANPKNTGCRGIDSPDAAFHGGSGSTRIREMATIPDSYLDLLQQKKAFANLATVMADGSPQVTPVWFDYVDGVIRVNTAKGRVKSRTLKPGAPVALAIMDPDNPYRYVQIRGQVRRAVEQGADAHIDSLAKKYLGKDTYPFRQPGEVRVMYEIEPTSVSGMS